MVKRGALGLESEGVDVGSFDYIAVFIPHAVRRYPARRGGSVRRLQPSATAMRVLLYDSWRPGAGPDRRLDPNLNRWGDIWSIFVPGVGTGQLYHFQAEGPHDPKTGLRFDGKARLIDPYAKALAGDFLPAEGGIVRPPKCVVVDDQFDWQGDRHLRRSLARDDDLRDARPRLHLRQVQRRGHPGTYLGLIEKIPYLQSLGVTAVELMPVFEFPMNDCVGQPAERPNYWGYDPLAFFAPHRGYAVRAASPAARSASSRRWCWPCTGPASK